MKLDIDVSTLNDLTWITLDGELDLATARGLERRLDAIPLAHTDVRLDLSELTFVDSAGLSVLLRLANRAEEEGRRVTLVRPRPEVARLLWLVDVAGRFHLEGVPEDVGVRV
jgi:anti-sigma B factor antagonist